VSVSAGGIARIFALAIPPALTLFFVELSGVPYPDSKNFSGRIYQNLETIGFIKEHDVDFVIQSLPYLESLLITGGVNFIQNLLKIVNYFIIFVYMKVCH